MHPAYQESKHLNENLCCFAVAISIECLNEVSLCNSNIYIKFQTINSDSNIVPDNYASSKLAFVHHPVILG